MAKKLPAAKRKTAPRKPPVRIAIPFDAAVDGILGMSPETAKKINSKVAAKRKKIDGRGKK